jgi:shikimate dehydrogenase
MRTFGLIGFPLEHSFSPGYFSEKFFREGIGDAEYKLFPLEQIEDLEGLFKAQPDLCGLNVTIPYKQVVMRYLDGLDVHAQAMGAVNTIRFEEGNKIGFNTDWIGFRDAISPMLNPDAEYKALVLGTGGSSKAVHYALRQMGIQSSSVSREVRDGVEFSYKTLGRADVGAHKIIINTTPLGMHPDTMSRPDIPYEAIGPEHILFDLVYNPEKTVFLIKGEQQGAAVKNGLEMLHRQAEAAWTIWNA